MPNRYTVLVELVAKREGQYTNYVFKNLDEPENSWDRYIQVTRLPNWECYEKMDLGVQGFLTFEPVEAGAKYYNANSLEYAVYKCSGIYFINFVKAPEKQQDINYKF